jgi:hypothetical protein
MGKPPISYNVMVWHMEKDKVFRYTIDAKDAVSAAFDSGPNRTIAGIRARERCAEECGEQYSPDIHKVLGIKEIH